ncbi:leucine-rich repeat receptor protein kinase MSP1 [Cinnamomum micranthum f. kanehirae]|uniref:Leucine-rich repeat receptor protein kinase MSP1 n=1 Tax=Cinnamomum micranthum f. kanehirae TaxID=337451 RepID=A0A3S3QYR2_9MAGN|nr:leucine-rich repeat receptor protein kinase MSP1 [Cinnamomum micranthum f. kanehirae]
MGNPLLCGPPLWTQCTEDETHCNPQPVVDGEGGADHEDELTIQLFYIRMAPGFVVGFWVACGTLLLKRSWRLAYYRFFDDMENRLYIKVARNNTKFKKKEGLRGVLGGKRMKSEKKWQEIRRTGAYSFLASSWCLRNTSTLTASWLLGARMLDPRIESKATASWRPDARTGWTPPICSI